MTTRTPRTPKIHQARASHTMTRRGLFLGVVALLATALLALAACGDGGGPAATPTATSLVATPTAPENRAPPAATEPEPTAAPTFTGSREPVDVPGPAAPPVLVLRDVRAAAHEGYDRIVFEFSDTLPGYRVEYVTDPTDCGSGEPSFPGLIGGGSFLQVRFSPAAAHNDMATPTFGQTELTLDFGRGAELRQTCDFEAVLTWVLLLSRSPERDFRVTPLENPPRLAVDIASP